MVDPNPARGMPLQLQRYFLAGKGAMKIRWNVPGDFKRCVRILTRHFPKNPEGLCNILHTKATGGPPGHGSLEHSTSEALTAAATLLAAQPSLGDLWAGALAPIGRPTGEPRRTRIFEPGSIGHRPLPLPLSYRARTAQGHDSSVVVGRILGASVGPDHEGNDQVYAWGDWLDPEIVPEVVQARYMVDQGLFGPSLDPGGQVRGTMNPETGAEHTTSYVFGGATLVSIAAFPGMRVYNLGPDGEWPDDDPDMTMELEGEHDCGCGHKGDVSRGTASMSVDSSDDGYAVNEEGWRGLPLAARESVFDADDAVKRIAAWAGVSAKGADVGKLQRAFLWRDQRTAPTDPRSYRLPVGDIVNGQLTLVYHAIYAAAALISGAHGGLPGIPDGDKNQLRSVITNIYQAMAKDFNDASVRAPWDRPEDRNQEASMDTEFASSDKPYGDVVYADPGYQKDGKARYPLDSEAHVRAAWSYINQEDNQSPYNPKQLMAIRKKIMMAMKKFGIAPGEGAADKPMMDKPAMMASAGAPLEPPSMWFANPGLTAKTPLTISRDGRVFGHLAAWGECHRDVSQRECVLAPHSAASYAPFHLGEVLTAEGESVRVGKIIMDTRHADIQFGYLSAAIHYDNTGDEVAVVRAGEDEHGIWVAGAVVPEATAKQVAKLRRSPLSGDWRAVDGNLELTAALAVNVPAFPVYAMEGEDRTALTAAGTVYREIEEVDLDVLVAAVKTRIEEDDSDSRAWRLRELVENEELALQRQRADRLALLAAAEPPVTAPAAGQDGQPDVNGAAAVARQADARFSVVAEAGQAQ
jgi:hypothetical protein